MATMGRLPDFSPSQTLASPDGSACIGIDTARNKLCLMTHATIGRARVIAHRDILSVEVFEDGASVTKTSRSSQLGGALVGGLVLGGVGAIIGGCRASRRPMPRSSGSSCASW